MPTGLRHQFPWTTVNDADTLDRQTVAQILDSALRITDDSLRILAEEENQGATSQ